MVPSGGNEQTQPTEATEIADADVSTSARKTKKPKTPVENRDCATAEDAVTYPESPSERRKMKAQEPDAEACCTTNTMIQSKLEDLKCVIRTPRQYPPASNADILAEKKQLNIGHFVAKQEEEEKPKKNKKATHCRLGYSEFTPRSYFVIFPNQF